MKFWIAGIVFGVATQLAAAHSESTEHSQEIAKTVAGGAGHEDCVRAKKGHRVEYSFESSRPVEFSIHYHDRVSKGHAHATFIIGPAMFESSPSDAGFTSDAYRVYCMVWTNTDEQPLQLNYRHNVHPPEH